MKYMMVIASVAALASAGASAQNGRAAQEAEGPRTPIEVRSTPGETPQRIRSVTVRPGEACPASSGDEVVVCYRPDGSPYRIPSELRDEGPIPAQNQAWAARAETVRDVSRVAGGLPNTCSPVGNGGQTGCALIQQPGYAAERRARRRQEAAIPGGEED